MEWWEAILLGIVQGLTEFLPVSSSGHLMIARELVGVDASGFLDFTVTVHFATVLSTIIVFWSAIWKLLKGIFKFKYNDETDYFLKLCVSMIPVAVVGFFFKDKVEALFGDSLLIVGICLIITAALLLLSTYYTPKHPLYHRNGISYLQAFVVGISQAIAVVPASPAAAPLCNRASYRSKKRVDGAILLSYGAHTYNRRADAFPFGCGKG